MMNVVKLFREASEYTEPDNEGVHDTPWVDIGYRQYDKKPPQAEASLEDWWDIESIKPIGPRPPGWKPPPVDPDEDLPWDNSIPYP